MSYQPPHNKNKINNSYESEPSSGGASASSTCEQNDELYENENMNLSRFLQPRSAHLISHGKGTEELRYRIPLHSSQESSFEGFSETSFGRIKQLYGSAISPKMLLTEQPYNAMMEENSTNAVDLQLHKTATVSDGHQYSFNPSTELSFNGKIRNLKANSVMTECSICPTNTIASTSSLTTSHLTESFILKKYSNEKSPDLFAEDDNDNSKEHDAGLDVQGYENMPSPEQTDNEDQCNPDKKGVPNFNRSVNCPAESSFADDLTCDGDDIRLRQFRESCKREKELLRRIRRCLAGVPPPPSLTIPQIDMFQTILSQKERILNFVVPVAEDALDNETTSSIFKPTHTLEEVKNMSWREIRSVRQHGLNFNLSKASEDNELLSLSVIDRFIGCETASSYRNAATPSSAKKRSSRLKLLTQSPGNRLSHLAKRRAIFSSANLATSQKSLGPQILIENKKTKHKRKSTPKRKTPASKKKNRKTPSSARKGLFRCDLPKLGASRETSKRALFQSPAKQLDLRQISRRPEIANRVEKSKRALFSPDKLLLESSGTSASFTKVCDNSKLDILLKRKRNIVEDDEELAIQSSKLFRSDSVNLTPRTLQIKSQSFCVGSATMQFNDTTEPARYGSSNQNVGLSHSQWAGGSSNSLHMTREPAMKMQRAHSDMAVQTNSLTENQRKKLLWAVSQALQERKISAKHEHFKQYASVLARVVRRIFQEHYQKSNTNISNSEIMLRLAKKYAYNVIGGAGADDIYFQAKGYIDETKSSTHRLSGYIGPEEYQKRNISHQIAVAAKAKQHSFSAGLSQQSSTSHRESMPANVSCIKDSKDQRIATVLDITQLHAERLPIQTNIALENSSSKNNLNGLVLRENVDCEQRRSAQKNFTGKDQRNLSPFVPNASLGSGLKIQSHNVPDMKIFGARRQISFDS